MRADIVPTLVAIIAGFFAFSFAVAAWRQDRINERLADKLQEAQAGRRVAETTLGEALQEAFLADVRAERYWRELVSMQKRAGLFLGETPPVAVPTAALGVPIIAGAAPVLDDDDFDGLVEELNGAWYWDLS